ncbi:MAG: SDR family NAD(P)-dependent oxidoreductase [Bacteroidales bacterium]
MKKSAYRDLTGKICVITGGAGVLGSSMARGLASAGVIPVLLDIREDVAREAAEEIRDEHGGQAFGFGADVLDKNSLEAVKKEIDARVGTVDLLLNAAGGNAPQATTQVEQIAEEDLEHLERSFFGLEPEGFQKVFDLNFKGTLLPTLVYTRDMVQRQQGWS